MIFNDVIQIVLNMAEAKVIDIDLTGSKITRGVKLSNQIARRLNENPVTFLKSLKNSPAEKILDIAVLIADDFNEEDEVHGELGKSIFKLIQEVLKTDERLDKMQIFDLLKKAKDFGEKAETYLNEITQKAKEAKEAIQKAEENPDFLDSTTSQNITES